MAIAIDVSQGITFANVVSSVTQSLTCGSGSDRLIRIAPTWQTSVTRTISSITYAGLACTIMGTSVVINDGSYDYACANYRRVAPSTGANNMVITMSGDCEVLGGGGDTWTGVDQTTPNPGNAGNSGTTGAASVTISSSAGEYVLGVYCGYQTQTPTGAGHTQSWDQHDAGTGTHGNGSYKAHTVTSMAWTPDQGYYWAAHAARIAASAGATILLDHSLPHMVTHDLIEAVAY